jgi:hypothetical protein
MFPHQHADDLVNAVRPPCPFAHTRSPSTRMLVISWPYGQAHLEEHVRPGSCAVHGASPDVLKAIEEARVREDEGSIAHPPGYDPCDARLSGTGP